jgi:diketogulonate reductase-like aldo/keto reductase
MIDAASGAVQGVALPRILYGTAWKEERTGALVGQALAAGFRGIDTANQRKHYVEAAVGPALSASGVAPDAVFLQTKFTYRRGQDDRLPYDPRADLTTQVRQSFDRSCEHLGVQVIDSLLLHGPWNEEGWASQDREVWRAMEALHGEGRVRLIGVSNVERDQLWALCREARVAPALVQNRCYARTMWDREVRELCRAEGVVYQGFSLLTANRRELLAPQVARVAARLGASVAQVVFAFAVRLGMLPLTGTTSADHMADDLAAVAAGPDGLVDRLDDAELAALERLRA